MLAEALLALADYQKGKWLDPSVYRERASKIWDNLGWKRLPLDMVVYQISIDESFLDKVIDTISEAGLIDD